MISSQQLGERLADARKRAKLNQADVASSIGVARTTLVAIEKGERRPSNAELVGLASVLRTSVHDLLRETLVRTEISPRFRASFDVDKKDTPVADAVERLRKFGARYAELERLRNKSASRVPARLEMLRAYRLNADIPQVRRDDRMDGEDAARSVRNMFGLGDEPALNLDQRLESEAGLRIFYLSGLPAKLAAFLIWSDDIGPCVAINADHPAEKQRWSLVHETGHLLRDPEAGDILDDREALTGSEEIFPESFTTEFLLPSVAVQKRFADKCRAGHFTPIDLYALARHFEVSFQAMALRLEDLRLLKRGTYEKISKSQIRPRDLARHVQPKLSARRGKLPERYIDLAVWAYDQEHLSEGELADYLDTDIASAREVYQQRQRLQLDDGSQLPVDFAAGDLRTA